jgi:hypothetical protein
LGITGVYQQEEKKEKLFFNQLLVENESSSINDLRVEGTLHL